MGLNWSWQQMRFSFFNETEHIIATNVLKVLCTQNDRRWLCMWWTWAFSSCLCFLRLAVSLLVLTVWLSGCLKYSYRRLVHWPIERMWSHRDSAGQSHCCEIMLSVCVSNFMCCITDFVSVCDLTTELCAIWGAAVEGGHFCLLLDCVQLSKPKKWDIWAYGGFPDSITNCSILYCNIKYFS